MTESLQEAIKNISEQLIADGYTDVYYDDAQGLLMATDPDGQEHAINVVLVGDEEQT